MNEWLWILQRAPIAAPRWISTNGPDAALVADPAAVEVRERVDDDAVAELDVVDQPVRRLVGRPVSHGHERKNVARSRTTASSWSSSMPGKIGSEMRLARSASATGKAPGR